KVICKLGVSFWRSESLQRDSKAVFPQTQWFTSILTLNIFARVGTMVGAPFHIFVYIFTRRGSGGAMARLRTAPLIIGTIKFRCSPPPSFLMRSSQSGSRL